VIDWGPGGRGLLSFEELEKIVENRGKVFPHICHVDGGYMYFTVRTAKESADKLIEHLKNNRLHPVGMIKI